MNPLRVIRYAVRPNLPALDQVSAVSQTWHTLRIFALLASNRGDQAEARTLAACARDLVAAFGLRLDRQHRQKERC